MLIVKNITYQVGNKMLLDDVSLLLKPGKLNLIIGPNGAGKSTLVKLMASQMKPHSGTVLMEGVPLSNYSLADLAKFRAVLSQNVDLAFPLTVKELVMMGRYPHFKTQPKISDIKACEEAMIFFGVIDLANRNFLTLSGGEKQRVHFARVAAQIWYPEKGRLRYLFLDEPLTFLDVGFQYEFMKKIKELLNSKDLLVAGVIHDLNLAAKFSDHLILIDKGKLIADGKKEDVLTKDNIKMAYGIEPTIFREKEIFHLFF